MNIKSTIILYSFSLTLVSDRCKWNVSWTLSTGFVSEAWHEQLLLNNFKMKNVEAKKWLI